MGCSTSKLVLQNGMPSGIRQIQHKIEKMKEQRQTNVSIVSRDYQLLEEVEDVKGSVAEKMHEHGIVEITVVAMAMAIENDNGVDNIEKITKKDDEVKLERLPSSSPSFRIYIKEETAVAITCENNDFVKVIQNIKQERLNEPVEISKQLDPENEVSHQAHIATQVNVRVYSKWQKAQKTVSKIIAENRAKEKERAVQAKHTKENKKEHIRRSSLGSFIAKEDSETKHTKRKKIKKFKSISKAFHRKIHAHSKSSDTSIFDISHHHPPQLVVQSV